MRWETKTVPSGRRDLLRSPSHGTARRSFETAYWKTIATLATGRYRNKDNADCVHDHATLAKLDHHHRDLEALGDFILKHYRRRGRTPRT